MRYLVNGMWRYFREPIIFRFKFIKPLEPNGTMLLETKTMIHTVKNTADSIDLIEMNGIQLPDLQCDIIPFYTVNRKRIFPFWVEIERVDL